MQSKTDSLDAYDHYLRGMTNLHRGTRESIDEALARFNRALQLDPNFASAHAMAAWCYFWRKVNGWMTDRPREIAEGARLARRAVELGGDDAVALTRGGHALGHLAGDVDGGIALIDRALALNPNLASAWFLGGYLRVCNGEPDGATGYFERAMRLSPLDPEMYRMQAGMAMAHLFAGRFDTASSWAEKAFRQLPSFLGLVGVMAASLRLQAERTKRSERSAICVSSIPRSASPVSGIGSPSADRRISRRSPMACDEQGYRNDDTVPDGHRYLTGTRLLLEITVTVCAISSRTVATFYCQVNCHRNPPRRR